MAKASVKPRRRLRKQLGGTTFESFSGGHWVSLDRIFAVVSLFKGMTIAEWGVFRCDPFKPFPPSEPFDDHDNFDWSWEELDYRLTMDEAGKSLGQLRDKSRTLLPRLVPNETMLKSGRSIRLVREITPDADCGAILRMQGADPMDQIEFWSTYDCQIVDDWYRNFKYTWKGEA
jgi:hypothetical protein